MSSHRITVVVGSNRKASINRKLAQALIRLAPASLTCDVMRIDDLPVFNQDDEQNPEEVVVRVKRHIASSAGALFVTAEHNRSIPAVLKNALNWGGRPYGQNSWAGKPAALIGALIGTIGTAIAQQHLCSVLGYLDMPTLAQPAAYIHFTDDLIGAGRYRCRTHRHVPEEFHRPLCCVGAAFHSIAIERAYAPGPLLSRTGASGRTHPREARVSAMTGTLDCRFSLLAQCLTVRLSCKEDIT